MNPINRKEDRCFQYAVTVTLIHEGIKKDFQRITKIKYFINRYNWEEINFPSEKDDWKKIEKNNLTFALNVFMLKMRKYILLTLQTIIQIVKKVILAIITNVER